MELSGKLKDAICNNDIDFLEEKKHLFSIDERFEDENNDTLLLYSISDAKSNVYKYLIENKANINLTNDEGENIIHAIVFSGEDKRLQDIVENYVVNINRSHRYIVWPNCDGGLFKFKAKPMDQKIAYKACSDCACSFGNWTHGRR